MQQLNRLAKFLNYVLGCRPDEFGLILDADGYVKIKTLLQALSEEAGWRHVRRAHLRELTLSLPNCPLEIVDQKVRALDRSRLRIPPPDTQPPKLLYTNVRQKAYAHVLDNGISTRGIPLILCRHEEMAARIGRRKDRNAVQIIVNTDEALAMGVVLLPCGEGLYQADQLPPGCFTGPPLPKVQPPKRKPSSEPLPETQTPGSFFLDLEAHSPDKGPGNLGKGPGNLGKGPKNLDKGSRKQKRKDQAWKKERRRRHRKSKDEWP
jgi:putative RNA 2'-phosphotransferase